MYFIWDPAKDQANQRKHGISFMTAAEVFQDPELVSRQDREVEGEVRWQTVGRIHGLVIVLVAHTAEDDDRGDQLVRIISARKATPRERRDYEQAHDKENRGTRRPV